MQSTEQIYYLNNKEYEMIVFCHVGLCINKQVDDA